MKSIDTIRRTVGDNLIIRDSLCSFTAVAERPQRFSAYSVQIDALDKDMQIMVYCPIRAIDPRETRYLNNICRVMNKIALHEEELHMALDRKRGSVCLRASLFIGDLSEEESAAALERKLSMLLERMNEVDDIVLRSLYVTLQPAGDGKEALEAESIGDDPGPGEGEGEPDWEHPNALWEQEDVRDDPEEIPAGDLYGDPD